MNLVDDGEHGHIVGGHLVGPQVEGPGGEGEHEPENNATDHATQAGGTRIGVITANDNGHGCADHKVEAHIIHGGDAPMGRDRGDGVDGLLQNRVISMASAEDPHNGDGHKHNDERRDRADDLGDLINVEKPNDERNGKQNEGTNPGGKTKLLIQVGAGTGKHDRAGAKQGDEHPKIQEPSQQGVADPPEHSAMVAGKIIAAELDNNQPADSHDERGKSGGNNADLAVGNEVLQHLLAGGKTGADDDANERQDDSDSSLEHWLCLLFTSLLLVSDWADAHFG